MSGTARVYVNGRGVDAPRGSSALDAVRLVDAAEADAIAAGHRALADSRGLPLDATSEVFGGAIYRTVSSRQRPSP